MPENGTLGQLKRLIATPETPELGPGPRPGVQALAALQKQLDLIFRHPHASMEATQLIRAIILLWHDHLDAAHNIAQEIETTDGSYVHGIMHRREPDYGNAKYWFRRVGRHACFQDLADEAKTKLAIEPALQKKLVSHDEWDPFAFVDACAHVEGFPVTDPKVKLLRVIQQAEFENLLEHFCQVES